jgi:hypothetical protein
VGEEAPPPGRIVLRRRDQRSVGVDGVAVRGVGRRRAHRVDATGATAVFEDGRQSRVAVGPAATEPCTPLYVEADATTADRLVTGLDAGPGIRSRTGSRPVSLDPAPARVHATGASSPAATSPARPMSASVRSPVSTCRT